MGIHQEQTREDLQTDLMYEEIKMDEKTKRGKEFKEKQDKLVEKLREVNADKFKVDMNTIVIEKKIEPVKVYSQRYRTFKRGLDTEGRRKLGD